MDKNNACQPLALTIRGPTNRAALTSIHLECLLQELGQVGQEGGLLHEESDAGFSGGRLDFESGAKGDDREVCGSRIGSESLELKAGGVPGGEVGNDQHRLGVFGLLNEFGQIGDRLNPVAEVLHAVDKLAGRNYPLAEYQRERLCHYLRLVHAANNCKKFRAKPGGPFFMKRPGNQA